jgi:hypothetical protein
MAEVGGFLGYGRDSDEWSAAVQSEVDGYVQAGVRQFYFPPHVEGVEPGYEWSFMRPTGTLALVAGQWEYDAPDDFGRLVGDLFFPEASGYSSVPVVAEARILALRQGTDATARPYVAASRAKAYDRTTGQRWEILVHPTPDKTYTLTYRYEAYTGKLTAAQPYPLGGMKHSDAIIESCLAVAEQRADNERGLHWEAFVRALSAAVQRDRRMGAAYFGNMGNRDNAQVLPRRQWGSSYPIVINGVTH